ncbi:hypothetical protein Cgig2_032662 [Carnegiea gigantea]|uniref:Uncharacterized protein n=1 Tax=Carnegiea gigantea TaxID=171969 RepID=A0A9Q1K108_9CARY|nr:hypothetical protein Cgig2_032662 [Carnegiea gigantea]
MLLIDAVKLGILRGRMIGVMKSALKELRWSTFQACVARNRGRILGTHRQEASSDLEEEESSGSDDRTPLSSDGSEERPSYYGPTRGCFEARPSSLGCEWATSWSFPRMGCLCSGDIDAGHLVTCCHVARTQWCPDAGQLRNMWSPFGPIYSSL